MIVPRPDLDFKLSITRALADQLEESLRRCHPAPLTAEHIDALQKRPGVYQLLVDEELVYIGKASKSLPARLAMHARKLSGRHGFTSADVRFVCLYVDEDLEASAPEKLLIKRHRDSDEAPWNTNGFGNNDPGRERDTSTVAADHFDALHPIDLDIRLVLPPGPANVLDVLERSKAALPYLLRYADPKKVPAARTDYAAAWVTVPEEPVSVRALLAMIVHAFPSTWQATALPGYVILYPENPREYHSAMHYWRATTGGVGLTEGPHRLGGRIADTVQEDGEGGDGATDE